MSERMNRRRAEINRAENLFEFNHGDAPYFASFANRDVRSPQAPDND